MKTYTYENAIAKLALKMDIYFFSNYELADSSEATIEKGVEEIKMMITDLFDGYIPKEKDIFRKRFLLEFSNIEDAQKFAKDIKEFSMCFKEVRIQDYDNITVLIKGSHPLDVKWEPSPNQA